MEDVKIFYKHAQRTDDKFEDRLHALMLEFGLERWASGFDLCKHVRDIAYRKPRKSFLPAKKFGYQTHQDGYVIFAPGMQRIEPWDLVDCLNVLLRPGPE